MGTSFSFEKWKELLRNDCIVCDKLRAFDSLGDSVLRVLYDNSVDPTVDAIVNDGLNGPRKLRPTLS